MAHSLQQPVAGLLSAQIHLHQRVADQLLQQIHNIVFGDALTRTHGLRRAQGPAAREDREPRQQQPFLIAQQAVAPFQRGAQSLLARQQSAAAAGQQPEAVA